MNNEEILLKVVEESHTDIIFELIESKDFQRLKELLLNIILKYYNNTDDFLEAAFNYMKNNSQSDISSILALVISADDNIFEKYIQKIINEVELSERANFNLILLSDKQYEILKKYNYIANNLVNFLFILSSQNVSELFVDLYETQESFLNSELFRLLLDNQFLDEFIRIALERNINLEPLINKIKEKLHSSSDYSVVNDAKIAEEILQKYGTNAIFLIKNPDMVLNDELLKNVSFDYYKNIPGSYHSSSKMLIKFLNEDIYEALYYASPEAINEEVIQIIEAKNLEVADSLIGKSSLLIKHYYQRNDYEKLLKAKKLTLETFNTLYIIFSNPNFQIEHNLTNIIGFLYDYIKGKVNDKKYSLDCDDEVIQELIKKGITLRFALDHISNIDKIARILFKKENQIEALFFCNDYYLCKRNSLRVNWEMFLEITRDLNHRVSINNHFIERFIKEKHYEIVNKVYINNNLGLNPIEMGFEGLTYEEFIKLPPEIQNLSCMQEIKDELIPLTDEELIERLEKKPSDKDIELACERNIDFEIIKQSLSRNSRRISLKSAILLINRGVFEAVEYVDVYQFYEANELIDELVETYYQKTNGEIPDFEITNNIVHLTFLDYYLKNKKYDIIYNIKDVSSNHMSILIKYDYDFNMFLKYKRYNYDFITSIINSNNEEKIFRIIINEYIFNSTDIRKLIICYIDNDYPLEHLTQIISKAYIDKKDYDDIINHYTDASQKKKVINLLGFKTLLKISSSYDINSLSIILNNFEFYVIQDYLNYHKLFLINKVILIFILNKWNNISLENIKSYDDLKTLSTMQFDEQEKNIIMKSLEYNPCLFICVIDRIDNEKLAEYIGQFPESLELIKPKIINNIEVLKHLAKKNPEIVSRLLNQNSDEQLIVPIIKANPLIIDYLNMDISPFIQKAFDCGYILNKKTSFNILKWYLFNNNSRQVIEYLKSETFQIVLYFMMYPGIKDHPEFYKIFHEIFAYYQQTEELVFYYQASRFLGELNDNQLSQGMINLFNYFNIKPEKENGISLEEFILNNLAESKPNEENYEKIIYYSNKVDILKYFRILSKKYDSPTICDIFIKAYDKYHFKIDSRDIAILLGYLDAKNNNPEDVITILENIIINENITINENIISNLFSKYGNQIFDNNQLFKFIDSFINAMSRKELTSLYNLLPYYIINDYPKIGEYLFNKLGIPNQYHALIRICENFKKNSFIINYQIYESFIKTCNFNGLLTEKSFIRWAFFLEYDWLSDMIDITEKNKIEEFNNISNYFLEKDFFGKNIDERSVVKAYTTLLRNYCYYPIFCEQIVKEDLLSDESNALKINNFFSVSNKTFSIYSLDDLMDINNIKKNNYKERIEEINETKEIDNLKSIICEILFNMSLEEVKNKLIIYGNTESLRLLQFNNRHNLELYDEIQEMMIYTSMMEAIAYEEDYSILYELCQNIIDHFEESINCSMLFVSFDEKMRNLFEKELNTNLTRANQISEQSKLYDKEKSAHYGVPVIDLSSSQHCLAEHVVSSREKIEDLVNGNDNDDMLTICISIGSNRNHCLYNDSGGAIILATDELPPAAFIRSSIYNMGSNGSISKGSFEDRKSDQVRNQRGALETSISPSGNNEVLAFRKGVKFKYIVVPCNREPTPTEIELAKKYNLTIVIVQEYNKSISNPQKIEETDYIQEQEQTNSENNREPLREPLREQLLLFKDMLIKYKKSKRRRIAIFTDAHALFEPTLAILEDARRSGISEIYSLGDNIGTGPNPKEVMELLDEYGVTSIMGNHELYALVGGIVGNLSDEHADLKKHVDSVGNHAEVERNGSWTASQLTPEMLEKIANYPSDITIEIGGKKVRLTHYVKKFDGTERDYPANGSEIDHIFQGHIHFAGESKDGTPTSTLRGAGIGFDSGERGQASYIILTETDDGYEIEVRKINYNSLNLRHSIEESSMPELDKNKIANWSCMRR